MPLIDHLRRMLLLHLREPHPVAIVIVAHILVIKHGRIGSLGWSAQRLLIPIHDQLLAVRVLRRNHQQNHILESRLHIRIIRACHAVDKRRSRLRAGDLGRVDVVGNDHHRFPARDQSLRLIRRGRARVR